MTGVRVLIKYSPNIIEVTNSVMDRLDFWRKATDGIGRCKLKLLGDWDGQFAADDPIQIRLDDIVVFEGYIDKGLPIAESGVYNQFYELVGRDYGQDLMDKQVDKTGDWMYEVQYADLIIDDMLSRANSEITFTPSGDHKYGTANVIPSIAYTDQGDEYLLEAFRKIFEQINYDFYVDENKALQIFPVGTYDSGIDLNCVVGAAGNNLLSLTKTEFDSQDLKNYVIARVDKINDGWTDGNAADFTGTTGNTISDDFTNKNSNKGIGSIKSLKAAGADVSIVLTFPKFNYTSLPFDVIGEDVLRLAYRFTGYPTLTIPRLRLILEDDAGNKITWRVAHPQLTTDMWFQLEVPIGNKVTDDIVGYNNWMGIAHNDPLNQWQYETAAYTTFNWKVVKITFANWMQAAYPTAIWIDSLTIPLPMIAVKQDPTSQGLYGVRRYFAPSKYVRTQLELDTYAASELAKLKDPIYGLHVTALGTAGILGSAFKWLPGYSLTVNSPADGISNVQYRISEAHCVVSEAGQQGHDFIVEADLVPYDALISGRRLSGTLTPEVAALRELSEKIRAIEKQEDLSLDYLPPLPADAAKKIQVGVFGTLAETVVAWTKLWEAEDCAVDANWAITVDAAASKGYCRKMSGVGLYEYQQTSNEANVYIHDGRKLAQTFTVGTVGPNKDFLLKYIKLQLVKNGTPGNVTVSIKATAAGKPTGAALSSVVIDGNAFDGSWLQITPAPEITLTAGVMYAIEIYPTNCTWPNFVAWRTWSGSSVYAGGTSVYWSGSEWFIYGNDDSTFEVYGWANATILFNNGILGVAGEAYLLTRVKVLDKTKAATCTLSVVDKDTSATLGTLTVTNASFPASAKYHHFALRVELPADKQNLEIKLVCTNCASDQNLYCDYAAILPANIPLGYTDVTVGSGTQNTSASDATQNSSANNATQNSTAQDATQNTAAQTNAGGTVGGPASAGYTAVVVPGNGTWTTLATPPCSADCDLYVLQTHFRVTAANFAGDIITRIRLYDETDGLYYPSSLGIEIEMWSDIYNYYAHHAVFTVPKNVNGHTLRLQFRQDTTYNMTLTGRDCYWGHSPHTHAMTNPSHSTGMTNPAHSTGVTNPAHSTGVVNPAHGHGVTDPSHEH